MLTRTHAYSKKEPDRDAKIYFIFCEGEIKEPNYFKYFDGISSRIKLEIVPHSDGKNSPVGLYDRACKVLLATDDSTPIYDLRQEDEIWFVIDTDSWEEKISELRKNCNQHDNWHIAQSNPCFELWLYYHFENKKPDIDDVEKAAGMKPFLNQKVKGGFDNRKHPLHIQTAIVNSERNFESENNEPKYLSTEVHFLAKRILPLIKESLDYMLRNL